MVFFFFQAEDGIRDRSPSRGLGDVYKRQGVSTIADSLVQLSALPGVTEATDAAREACTQLRWHQALRRRIPSAAAESRVRGARASAALDGAAMDVEVVRDLMRGAVAWSQNPDPIEAVLKGAVQATAETEHIRAMVIAAPSQAMARVHLAAAGHLLPEAQVGRPRRAGELSRAVSYTHLTLPTNS